MNYMEQKYCQDEGDEEMEIKGNKKR